MSTSHGINLGSDLMQGKLSLGRRFLRWWRSPHPFWARVNRTVAGAHSSITEVGETSRAELSAWIAVLMAVLAVMAIAAMALVRDLTSYSLIALLILGAMTLPAYLFSRTRFYRAGGWLITGSLIVVGYVYVILGFGHAYSLTSFVPLAFVLGSILLTPLAMLFWVVVGTYAMFFLPASLNLDLATMVSVFQTIGAALLAAMVFRDSIERRRLAEVRAVNRELQQANASVEASSQRTRTVFQTLTEGVGVLDPAGTLVEVNESLLHLAGCQRPEDLLGKNAAVLVAEAGRGRLGENFTRGTDLGKPVEYPLVAQDGRSYDGELTVSVLQDEQGQRTGFVLVVRDITLQKQAAAAVSQSEARQRQILDTIPVSVFITRLPGGQIVYVNQTTIDQFGLLPEQVAGKLTPDLYYDPEDRERLLATLRDQGSLSNFVARAKRQDTGEPFWGDLSGRMIEFGGENVLLTAIIDVTARRQAEESLLARDQVLQRNSAVIGGLSRSASITSGDLEAALQEITEAAAHTLETQRASVWFYNDDRDQLRCADLFEMGKGHTRGAALNAVDYPGYFAALQAATTVSADDAHAHPATREFSTGYLTPLGINSMLDAPIRLRGRVVGVLCCEHTGPKRHWTLEEENFSTSIVDFVATAMEAQERVRLTRQIEESYERRGVQVQLTTQIAQEISGATELNELFHRVVTLVKERFGYYHTQLLRYEESQDAVVLIEGYGEVGAQMLQARHRMPLGAGLIGTAAASGETVLRTELAYDPDWQPNPLLPNTQGEIAVPIKLRGQVLGVLDVQSNQAGALTQDDQILLEGLCGQIAVAIEETRLRQEMEERLQELNAVYASMSREGWQSMQDTFQVPGYVYDRVSVLPLVDLDENQQAEQAARQIVTKMLDSEKFMVAPLALHGSQQIGAVSVEDNPEQPLSAEDRAFVEQVAEQVALALESARLFAQTQNTLGETEDLYRGSAELSVAASYDQVLHAIRSSVDKAQEAHIVSIGLFDRPWTDISPAESVNIIATWSSLPPEVVAHFPLQFSVSDSPMTMALKPNEPSIIEDAQTDPTLDPQIRGMLLNALATRSAINAPLVVGGQWIGFMSISFPQPKKFAEADIRRVTALAGQAATVIQSLRLFRQTQEALAETQSLYNIASRISAARDLQEIVAVAAEEAHLPAMNRALLLVYNHGAKGEIESSVVRANWWSGTGLEPVPVGTRYAGAEAYGGQGQSFSLTEPTFIDATDETFRAVGIGSLASLPLWVGGQLAGTLSLVSDQPHTFTEQEKRPIAALAQQVAVSLQSRLLFEQVQANREQLSGALRIANMGYAEIDLKTNTISFSDEYYLLLHTSTEQEGTAVVPMDDYVSRFILPEDYPVMAGPMEAAIQAGGVEFEAEHRVRCKDGEIRWLRTQFSIERDEQGVPLQVLGAAQDITERKQTREALARRARELSTVADLGTRISAVLDPAQMLQTVTDLVKDNFSLYHAHIYLLNQKGDALELASGSGAVGRQMVRQGWQIPLEQEKSLVAGAARARQGVIVNDVRADEDFMPNELLPDTRAELAVPLMVGERVLGVMDIQSDEVNRFTDEDVSIQTVLASQVAVALQNARTYAQTQRQAEYEALINSISQKIQSTTSVENALQVAVRELGRALGASRTSVQLSLGKKGANS